MFAVAARDGSASQCPDTGRAGETGGGETGGEEMEEGRADGGSKWGRGGGEEGRGRGRRLSGHPAPPCNIQQPAVKSIYLVRPEQQRPRREAERGGGGEAERVERGGGGAVYNSHTTTG